jgi:hypothetical protein
VRADHPGEVAGKCRLTLGEIGRGIEWAARGGYGASDATNLAVGTGERLLTEGLAQLFLLQGRLKAKHQRHLNE